MLTGMDFLKLYINGKINVCLKGIGLDYIFKNFVWKGKINFFYDFLYFP